MVFYFVTDSSMQVKLYNLELLVYHSYVSYEYMCESPASTS